MTIGATSGKEPDHIDDEDLLSVEEMRGTMRDIQAASLTNVEKATVSGVLREMEILKQMLADSDKQMNHLVGLYGTLKNEFNTFRENYVASLNLRVNSGSTTPEDCDGDIN
jgi:hypothetical protein